MYLRTALMGIVSAFGLPALLHAQVVNFHNAQTVGVFVGQGADPDPGNNTWNAFAASGVATSGNLTSSGGSTPITLTATYGFSNGIVNAADQGMPQYLLGNEAGVNGANPLGTFTLNNVPAGAYRLFLYGTNFDHNRGTTFTVSSGAPDGGVSSTLNNTITSFIEGNNYVVFNNVQPDSSGKISGTFFPNPADGVGNNNLSGEGSLNGLQLVRVPEPASAALLMLGGFGLLARRR